MRNLHLGQLIVGLALGVVLGGAGGWWLGSTHQPKGAPGHKSAPEAAEDEHGHAGHEAEEEHEQGHGSDAHAGHGEGEHEPGHEKGPLVLSAKAIRESGIEVAAAGSGELERTLMLPGEIVLNADRVAHIVPRVEGIVCRVDRNSGDEVREGDVLAVLESRELAEAKAAYLSARQQLALAEVKLQSAAELHAQKITPDVEYRAVQAARTAAEIALRSAENKLHTLGIRQEQLQELQDHDADFAMYELRAPFAGTVIRKHCSLGEVLDSQSDAFVIADLSTVWANITVYSQDIGRVCVGQTVQIHADGQGMTADGTICYLSPVADEATRTVCARVDLPNRERQWRPGTFASASVVLDRQTFPVVVPIDALQRVQSDNVVFVAEGEGFEPRTVTVGRMNHTHAEITGGLEPGQRYVAKGAVILKAELGKREAVHEH